MIGAAFAAAIPYFLARVAVINVLSVMALPLFLAGWLILTSAKKEKEFLKLSFSWVLFLAAGFLYNAFFFLGLAPVLHFLWLKIQNRNFRVWHLAFRFWLSFFAVAVLLYLGSPLFFPRSGIFVGYRSLDFGAGQVLFGLVGLLLLGAFLNLLRRIPETKLRKARAELQVFFFSFLLGWLALLPYALIGVFPPFEEWHTRYEINLFMPLSLLMALLLGRVSRYFSPRLLKGFEIILLVVAIVMTNLALAEFGVDSRKHNYIQAVLVEKSEALEGRYVVFVDKTQDLNALDRKLRFYEWSGSLSEATGSRTTFGDWGEDPYLSYGEYLAGSQAPYLTAVYNYRWREHEFPSRLAWVTIEGVRDNPCGSFERNFSSCLTVEVHFDETFDGD